MYALITGSSRGIGAAVAKRLAADGFDVIVHCRSRLDAANAVAAAVKDIGRDARVICCDVADEMATRVAINGLIDDGLEVGVVVNNAGINDDASFPQMSIEAWRRVTRITLDGFFNVTQPLIMPMVRRKWGRVINMSSVSGVMGNRGQVNYAAAKAGLIGATKSLAKELAKRRITVNAVAPGLVETDMISDVPLDLALKLVPARRVAQPDEIAAAVGYLASDAAAYITGQVININGGMT